MIWDLNQLRSNNSKNYSDSERIVSILAGVKIAKENILSVEVVDFEELGMEAVRKITVKDFPAFIITDDKGNDFFANL